MARLFIRNHPALALFLVAVAFGSALVGPVLAGWLSPKFLQLGALSASLAGFVLAAWEGGRPAVRELLSRAAIWRVGPKWWAAAFLLPIGPGLGALYLGSWWTGRPVDWSVTQPPYAVLPSMLVLIIFAGLGEEFGWRGFALSRLMPRHSALTAMLIVGSLHALWHIPLFLVEGEAYHTMATQLGFVPAFLGYAGLVLALSVQIGWIFLGARGSVLLAAVYHGAGNAWAGYFAIDRNGLPGQIAFVAANAALSLVLVPALAAHARGIAREPDR